MAVSALSSVDLPAQDGPTTASRQGEEQANDTPSSSALPPRLTPTSSAANPTAPASTHSCSAPSTRRNVLCPTVSSDSGDSGACVTRRPSTKVPLLLARSTTSHPWGVRRTSAWLRLTSGSSTTTLDEGSRPSLSVAPAGCWATGARGRTPTVGGAGASGGNGASGGSAGARASSTAGPSGAPRCSVTRASKASSATLRPASHVPLLLARSTTCTWPRRAATDR